MQYGIPENIILISPTDAVAEPLAQKIAERASIQLSDSWVLPLSNSQTIDPTNTFIIFAGQPLNCIEIQQIAQQIPTLWLTEQAEELTTVRNLLFQGFIGHLESADLASLKSIIRQGTMHFQTQYQLRTEIKSINVRLEERKQIDRAKGLLMQQHKYNESEAYAFIRKLSMDRAQRMGHVAKELLCETAEDPK